jgi:hypothetical protein
MYKFHIMLIVVAELKLEKRTHPVLVYIRQLAAKLLK